VHQEGLSVVDARVILKSDDTCRMSEDRCNMNGEVGMRKVEKKEGGKMGS